MMVSAAAALAIIARRFQIPSIIAYIVAGLLLGPVSGLLSVGHSIEVIAEVGIVLLLFLVGLELSLDKVKDVGMVAVITAAGQMGLTVLITFGLSVGVGFTIAESMVLAVALMFSSTVVVVKLLDQSKTLDSLFGRVAVGVLLVQDLAVIVALTFVAALGRGGDNLEIGALLTQLGLALLGMVVILATAALAARYLLPRPFAWISRSREGLFVWSLALCFVFVLLAEALQLSVEIGAFLAGLCLAQLPYNHDLQRQVHPLTNLFIAIFFVSLGIQMQLGAALEYGLAVAVFVVLTLVGKPLIIYLLIVRQGYVRRAAFMAGLTLAQVSEFGFIFTALAVGTGLVDDKMMSLVALVGLITISISSLVFGRRDQLFDWLDARGWLGKPTAADGAQAAEPEPLSDHGIEARLPGHSGRGEARVGWLMDVVRR